MNEQKLEEQFKQYQELAKGDKNIDVAKLMLTALQTQNANLISTKQKRWAYLISLGVPPFGLIFAIKFYLSGKDDGKQAAIICVALTIFSILIFWLIARSLISSSGVSLDQIQQIKPNDIQQLLQ